MITKSTDGSYVRVWRPPYPSALHQHLNSYSNALCFRRRIILYVVYRSVRLY
ncbi:hypothetical protein M407DRAFT_127583 [Tulasnella calospora MUT 4182]|uniref:Uncharacterized protein n=1 Tax=Tulasnella calospora MUT 4182 TaxID=1051891 RepID=A0A0C3LJY2_9AGAM|nr:hypothetical protein M407DRAFT_127583 [Tulasnella calospora MUT 4182]